MEVLGYIFFGFLVLLLVSIMVFVVWVLLFFRSVIREENKKIKQELCSHVEFKIDYELPEPVFVCQQCGYRETNKIT